MYSEKYLSQNMGYIWDKWLPNLNQHSISCLLQGKTNFASFERWAAPLQTEVPAAFNDLIAEIAFNSFATTMKEVKPFSKKSQIIDSDIDNAIQKMGIIRGDNFDKMKLTPEMLADSMVLRNRLVSQLGTKNKSITVNPLLRGYGKLTNSYADVIDGQNLVEIKISKFPFRQKDFRQLFLYAFLAWQARIKIEELTLVNPRRGEKVALTLEDFCLYFGQDTISRIMQRVQQDLK